MSDLPLAWEVLRRAVNGERGFVGMPGMRDPDGVCALFDGRGYNGRGACHSDGHYLCVECSELSPDAPRFQEYGRAGRADRLRLFLARAVLTALLALGVSCNDPLLCPDLVRPSPAPKPTVAALVPPPPAPPEPPEPAVVDVANDWISLPANLRTDPKYLNREVCRSLNTTCNGPQTKPCEDFSWTKILTRDQVLCVIAAHRIGGDLHDNRAARAEWIRGCGAPLECR